MKQLLEVDYYAVSHLLEPDVWKLTSPVLRRERSRKAPYLSCEGKSEGLLIEDGKRYVIDINGEKHLLDHNIF
jgi:hypothetical protein